MPLPSSIVVGSDHAGFQLKETIQDRLRELGIRVEDVGPYNEDSVDYPDFIHPVANAVEAGKHPLGIVICGSGQGAAITANKHQGIRCALCWTPEIGVLARQHNNANVLALAARFTSPEDAIAILDAFLNAEFEGGRHARRVDKMACS
ncbi:MAG: ribose 5-phosphate isomerase B [Saprospiraceae bacterium]